MSRVQAVEAGAARGAGQGGLYSYSRLLEIVNANTSSTGVKLEVKKKVSDYEYQPVDETDIANADFDIRLGQVVKTVAALPRAKKLQFSKDMRDAGNERFHAGDHKPAIEMYAQAMAGLDLGSDDAAVNDATLKDVALPIMTNMALSFLELRRPRHALSLCDQALKIDANCVKAHLRRSKALRMLDEYTAAREACEMAMSLARTDEERQAAQSALRKAVRLAVNTRTAAVQHGAKIRAALATEAFYADKPPAGKKKRSATAVGPPCTDSLARHFATAPKAARAAPPDEEASETGLVALCAIVVVVAILFRLRGPQLASFVLRQVHQWKRDGLWRLTQRRCGKAVGVLDSVLRISDKAFWIFDLCAAGPQLFARAANALKQFAPLSDRVAARFY